MRRKETLQSLNESQKPRESLITKQVEQQQKSNETIYYCPLCNCPLQLDEQIKVMKFYFSLINKAFILKIYIIMKYF